MTGAEWLRRWTDSRAPARGWADDCPAGLPVPEDAGCAATDCDSVCLVLLEPGARACVTCLQRPGSAAAATLGALGVLPGLELELIQRSPAFVLRIGYAEIALDAELAAIVRVRRL